MDNETALCRVTSSTSHDEDSAAAKIDDIADSGAFYRMSSSTHLLCKESLLSIDAA